VPGDHQKRSFLRESMREKKTTAVQLSRKLGLHHSTIDRLRRLPGAPVSFDDTEKWRSFALSNLSSVEAIVRVGR
jgi:hypothetical protein